jgi:transcription-repair coupling factor (superfamily II helicase)
MHDLIAAPTPEAGIRLSWQGLHGAAPALAIVEAARRHGSGQQGLTLVITDDTAATYRLQQELQFFAGPELEVLTLPDWETLAYDVFSPHQDIISDRLLTLHRLASLRHGILVVPVKTLLQRLPPRSFLDGHSLVLETGDRLDLPAWRLRLEHAGYRCVETVSERGEFAVRGALLDVFPMGAEQPFRIDLFDDEIETLRTFDPDSQRSIDRVQRIAVLPGREMPLDDAAIARFRHSWHERFEVDVRRCPVYQDVSQGLAPAGVEYYLPLFFDSLATLFDYLPGNELVICDAELETAMADFREHVQQRYESLRHDIERPILEPDSLYLRPEDVFGAFGSRARVVIDGQHHPRELNSQALPDLSLHHRAHNPAEALQQFLLEQDVAVLFCAESAGRREVLLEFLHGAGIGTEDCQDFASFVAQRPAAGVCIAPIEDGLWLDGLVIITETQLFGHRPEIKRGRQNRQVDPDLVFRNLTEMRTGAPVVHIDHGVGRYLGLQTLDIDGVHSEFLTIEYADGAKLYVPVSSLHLISRYSGSDEDHAPLHRLGSDQWEKAKRRAAEKVHDVAAELLNIYARREAQPGTKFQRPEQEYARFAAQFPFEVTPDQHDAIEAVIGDLCSNRAMDRLICGDVGFGKTEVAMRAAFITVQNTRQVALLVPTTLLAQQHYDNFRDRFADWPVQIEVVSRLRSDAELKSIQQRLAAGKIDILIGTHKLLAKEFRFGDLGMVIIDEEHRFGVRQKERLRSLRAEVAVLTLTATPIPRTLNMAMGGIRDFSLIATPPAKRLSVKTFVRERRRDLVREALSRELSRGGQVFYVHNEVRTIEQCAAEIQELVPEARIGIGHGQMSKRRLEQVMSDFYHRRLNVLVCTTIIETGIDIPNANTIIMDRADKFGLAQLHQLRGRVGRSSRQAYAYLLTPPAKAMTADARKRLEAIEAAGELGVGFSLATHDLEIRGAGELLGDDQSGQIESVGFSLYMDMLERAVKAIREGKTPDLDQPLDLSQEVNMRVPALIPDDYLPDVHTRLIMYKRIASAADADELSELRVEMVDRFGSLPPPLQNLFQVTRLRLRAATLGISRIDFGPKGGTLEFRQDTRVDPIALVRLVQSEPNSYRLEGGAKLRMTRALETPEQRFEAVQALLGRLQGDSGKEQVADGSQRKGRAAVSG